MLPIPVQSAAVAARSLSVSILGGVLDHIAISVTGLAGSGDKEAAAAAILASLEINGQRISKNGASSPFITTMTGAAFRSIRNTHDGFTRALDGFIIATNRQVFPESEGVTLRLRWDVPTTEDVDSTGAEILVERAQTFSQEGPEPLPVYEGTPITELAQKMTTTVPNLLRAHIVGGNVTRVALDVAGNGFTVREGYARLVSATNYEHEQTDAPALVLWDSDLAIPAAPTFTIHSSAAGGIFVQTGLVG